MQTCRVLFCAFPFGYGPAAKLLAIARRARARGLHPLFVGSGPALELVRRSAEAFDDVIEARASDPRTLALVADCAGVVSVMDRDAASLAAHCGKPSYVIDSLLWMRERMPAPFATARRYWAQRFFGAERAARRFSPAPSMVGPIVSALDAPRPPRASGLVIQLGGCASPVGMADDHYRYAALVIRALLESRLPLEVPCRVLVGRSCASRLGAEFRSADVEFRSESHESALRTLAAADVVLTSPGATATLECFSLGVPTFFLPPQNYSQWLALDALRAARLAPASLHWKDVAIAPAFGGIDEAERTPAVLGAIRALAADAAIRAELSRCLRAAFVHPRAELAARQLAAFESLGSNGAEEIGDELRFDLETVPSRLDQPTREVFGP